MSGPTDPAEAHFDKGSWGWDGTQWRRQPLTWGYSDRYAEEVARTNLPAGVSVYNGSVVPAGEVWVVTIAVIIYVGTSPTRVVIAAVLAGLAVTLSSQEAPLTEIAYPWSGNVILKAGDYVRGGVVGATAGDTLYVRFGGYKMKIAE